MRRTLAVAVCLSALSVIAQAPPVYGQTPTCKNPTAAQLQALAEQFGKTPFGEPAGVEVMEVSKGSVQNAALQEACPQMDSWCPSDTVLVVRYKKPVMLWHVERSIKTLESTPWFGPTNAKLQFTKAETVDLYALPDCLGWPVESPSFGAPNPIPAPPQCVPAGCQGTYPAGTVIQYVGASIIAAEVPMVFGYVGPNMWGPGGELQWYVPNFTSQKIVPMPPEAWPGE